MSRTQQLKGYIVTPAGIVRGSVGFASGFIQEIGGQSVSEQEARESREPIIVPGFVDLHVHGGGGFDTMDGNDAALAIAQQHAKHGTTSLLATTLTAPREDLTAAFVGVARAMAKQTSDAAPGAAIMGIHLEGPYINDAKLGAQPPFTRDFDDTELRALHDIAPIKLVTLAPEIPDALRIVRALNDAGIVVQLGHSDATYEVARTAFAGGARGVTHLYNAMSGLHHRKPGLVGAALAHAKYCEIIPDLLHVHEGAIRVAMRAIDGVYCVTDSTSAAGMPDGDYKLGRHTVTKCMGGVRLADGTLAGSTLTMDAAFRNLINVLELDLNAAVRRTSTLACEFLRLTDRGQIATGMRADLVVLNHELTPRAVYVAGVEQGIQ